MIAFSAMLGNDFYPRIYVMLAGGQAPRPITSPISAIDNSPSWQPLR
jgi:hypothetical protein